MKFRFAATPFALCALFTISSSAQQGAASLTGQVTDVTGAVVPGAQITVSDPTRSTKVVVTTDAGGGYTIPQLDPGQHYKIDIVKQGFKSFTQLEVTFADSPGRKDRRKDGSRRGWGNR